MWRQGLQKQEGRGKDCEILKSYQFQAQVLNVEIFRTLGVYTTCIYIPGTVYMCELSKFDDDESLPESQFRKFLFADRRIVKEKRRCMTGSGTALLHS